MKALNPIKFFVLITICIFCPRRLAVLIVLIAICLFTPAEALRAQTVTWTSSHPDIVSVDANTGAVQMISEPSTTTNVTITATTQQNGKTITSVKTVEVDSCTACFTFNSLTYCGVKLSNGQCWMDRNIGTTHYSQRNDITYAQSACPSGWRLPTKEEFLALIHLKTGNNSITYTTSRNSISTSSMSGQPLPFHTDFTYGGVISCPHVRVQTGFFNWGQCSGMDLYRTGGQDLSVSVRCIKQ